MISCEVVPLTNGTCHPVDPSQDRELRCRECGCRMFSSLAEEMEARGQRCVRCRGPVELVPVGRHGGGDGLFGREDADFTWERTDKADALRAGAGLDGLETATA